MALVGARLHKTGSVYSRIRYLVKSGVISYDDRPLWFDVYKAFPPIREPKFIPDPGPDELGLINVEDDVRPIFYEEDWARANFASVIKQKGIFSLLHDDSSVDLQTPALVKYVKDYEKLRDEDPGMSKDEAFMKVFSSHKPAIKNSNNSVKS